MSGLLRFIAALSLLAIATVSGQAQDFAAPGTVASRLPAVSGVNAKLEALGGVIDGEGLAAIGGSLAVPVPYVPLLGVQIDGLAGTWESDSLAGGALHIFLRDPAIGLIGAYGDWTYVSPEHYGRVGAELEVYVGRFSFEGIAGGSFGQNVDDEFFDEIALALYPTDDLRLSVGHVYSQLGHQGKAGIEYQLPAFGGPVGVSAFAEGRIGEEDYYGAWAGLRLYMAREPKSLIRRHREDDPRSRLPSSIAPLTNCKGKIGKANFCGSDDDLGPRPNPGGMQGGGMGMGGGMDGDGGGMNGDGGGNVGNASDRRLKTDIVELARLANGLGVYEYRYIGGTVRHIGVMAQEVRMIRPDAVGERDGHMTVDYARLFADPEIFVAMHSAGFAPNF